MLILSIVIFAEPVALTILYPFLFYMVKGFHLTDDTREIGFYAGFLAASFSLAQFLTSLPWGYISDRWGRRPVILLGLAGNMFTMILFGLSRNYIWALGARALSGFLNGNVATAKCVLGEITDASNQAAAFSVFGLAFGIGSLIAPTLGGLLAEPAVKYPLVFGQVWLFETFPYLLPCLVSALVSLVGWVVGYFYFEETLQSKRPEVSSELREQREPLLSDAPSPPLNLESNQSHAFSYRYAAFSTITAYSILAFTQIVFQEVFVFWCNADVHDGGLAWGTSEVGIAMALSGAVLLFVQLVIYPYVQRHVGNYTLYRDAMFAQVPMFAVTGFISASVYQGPAALWTWISLHSVYRVVAQSFAFTSVMMMINNSAHPKSLGLVNGVGQASASFVRAVGPALAGVIWSHSLKNGVQFPLNYHFSFLLLAVLSLLGGLQALMIPKRVETPLHSTETAPVDLNV
jgi:MFS family permease